MEAEVAVVGEDLCLWKVHQKRHNVYRHQRQQNADAEKRETGLGIIENDNMLTNDGSGSQV